MNETRSSCSKNLPAQSEANKEVYVQMKRTDINQPKRTLLRKHFGAYLALALAGAMTATTVLPQTAIVAEAANYL